MKTCAIPSCRNTTTERPDLCYFSLPRHTSVREEWLDVLDLKRRDPSQRLMVCELHFRAKDFCESKKNSRGSSNKKELKHHAVPVLRLNTCKIEPGDSEDEFMQCDSGDEPEILEVSPINSPVLKNIPEIKEEKIQIKEEPTSDLDSEPIGRRSSRKAALVAAKKIFNTVRNYGIRDDPGDPVATSSSPKTATSPRPYARARPKKETPIHVDLVMECKDDELSPVQAQSLVKAQLQYNMVMRNLRELTALNVRVIQTEPPAASNGTIKNGSSAPKSLKPKTPIPMVRPPALPSAISIISV